MVLNLSIRINEAQTQEMIGAKRDFFFKFIEKEVAELRYQVAQEHNYEQKNPNPTPTPAMAELSPDQPQLVE